MSKLDEPSTSLCVFEDLGAHTMCFWPAKNSFVISKVSYGDEKAILYTVDKKTFQTQEFATDLHNVSYYQVPYKDTLIVVWTNRMASGSLMESFDLSGKTLKRLWDVGCVSAIVLWNDLIYITGIDERYIATVDPVSLNVLKKAKIAMPYRNFRVSYDGSCLICGTYPKFPVHIIGADFRVIEQFYESKMIECVYEYKKNDYIILLQFYGIVRYQNGIASQICEKSGSNMELVGDILVYTVWSSCNSSENGLLIINLRNNEIMRHILFDGLGSVTYVDGKLYYLDEIDKKDFKSRMQEMNSQRGRGMKYIPHKVPKKKETHLNVMEMPFEKDLLYFSRNMCRSMSKLIDVQFTHH